jgi:hypothetical protein
MTDSSKAEPIAYHTAPPGMQKPPRAPSLALATGVGAFATGVCLSGLTALERVRSLPTTALVILWTSLVVTPLLSGMALLWGIDALRSPGHSSRGLGKAAITCGVLGLAAFAGWFAMINL